MRYNIPKNWVSVAKIGRSVGLKGELLLHLMSDFPESIQKNEVYYTQKGEELQVETYNIKRALVKFVGVDTQNDAKKLTNCILYSTQNKTKETCKLEEGEFFWFELIGARVIEESKVLGVVEDIERMGSSDFLKVGTSKELQALKMPKFFMIPFLERFIIEVLEKEGLKEIHTRFCKDILENS
ncbi:16S rRNA processing protein RimM [Helicobacter valdiviensis]|uniref:Ribosome maturation factor RimM n=1 Tax=Helicobacter valdiviensis TaxID=1458358 RepID=A0A2W6NEP3_9HELI|nr:ribosome maturation factor RimM [Helicobacter valdiviensis]PZT47450.1 16S rRNA processing protein RimM [Helicobacter valdiviensis]